MFLLFFPEHIHRTHDSIVAVFPEFVHRFVKRNDLLVLHWIVNTIYLNFIGAFEVPADIITPMELEEQRRIQEEQAAKEKRSAELEQERYEQRKQDARDFTVRMKAGLLTHEEQEEYNRKREHNRAWQKEWREKRKAAEPPKPPKPLSKNEIMKRKSAGLPLTVEELEIYEAHKAKRTAQNRAWRERQQATDLPTAVNQ